MINYEKTDTDYEFLCILKDRRSTAAKLSLSFSEEDKIKYLINWFNSILRNVQETPN